MIVFWDMYINLINETLSWHIFVNLYVFWIRQIKQIFNVFNIKIKITGEKEICFRPDFWNAPDIGNAINRVLA